MTVTVPSHACDCHAHVFGDPGLYPLAPGADYRPAPAPVAAYHARLDTLGLDRGVLVQPSVYGTDNRCLVDALDSMDGRARGVAVIDRDTDRQTLTDLHAAGVRGVRLNTLAGNMTGVDGGTVLETARQVAPLGWHVQLLAMPEAIHAWRDIIAAAPCPVVFDHFALMTPEADLDAPPAQAVFDLLATGAALVKLSAPYLKGPQQADRYGALSRIARRLCASGPDRVVWGSDWPHPALPGTHPEERVFLDILADWCPDPELRVRILVDTPAWLYDFPIEASKTKGP